MCPDGLTLTLSVGLAEYDAFQKNMDMAVLNAYELFWSSLASCFMVIIVVLSFL